MNSLRRNRIAEAGNQDTQLEAKVMLAASNIKITYVKNVSQRVRNAVEQAKDFWGKYINTSKQVSIRLGTGKVDKKSLGFHLFNPEKGFNGGKIKIDAGKKLHKNNPSALTDTVIHEIGHALMIGHKGMNGTIMAAQASNSKRTVNAKILSRLSKAGYRK
jgi:hypothetical protein